MINVCINMKIIYFKSSLIKYIILIYNYSFVHIESNRLRLCLEKYYSFVVKIILTVCAGYNQLYISRRIIY